MFVSVYMHVYTHKYMHIHTYIHTYAGGQTYICMYTHINTCIHIHTYTHVCRWTDILMVGDGTEAATSLYASTINTIILVTNSGSIYRTNTAGGKWSRIAIPETLLLNSLSGVLACVCLCVCVCVCVVLDSDF